MGQTADLPLISVLIPVYNVASYLEECLNSVLAQTYQHLEIILVDDGSTDGSGQICDAYADRDHRIRVYHQANGGVSAARNLALAQAQGDYVTIVDGDDGIHETFLETLYQHLMAQGADIAVSNYYKYSEFDGHFYFHNLHRDDLVEVLTPQDCLDYQCDIKDYIGMAFIPVWGKLYKRALFEHISFPEGLMIDDEVVTHKLFLTAEKVVLVNKNHYLYRLRPNSAMTSGDKFLKRLEDTLTAFEIKLTDMALAGLDTSLMARRFAYLLWDFKTRLESEANVAGRGGVYDRILQRLDWFNRHQKRKGQS